MARKYICVDDAIAFLCGAFWKISPPNRLWEERISARRPLCAPGHGSPTLRTFEKRKRPAGRVVDGIYVAGTVFENNPRCERSSSLLVLTRWRLPQLATRTKPFRAPLEPENPFPKLGCTDNGGVEGASSLARPSTSRSPLPLGCLDDEEWR